MGYQQVYHCEVIKFEEASFKGVVAAVINENAKYANTQDIDNFSVPPVSVPLQTIYQ